MAVFNEPTKWQTSLVNSGDANAIPQTTPAGSGEASFEEGFPQITQVPIGAGGQAPDRKDFNGLFKVLGDWIFFAQNGGIPAYSTDFDYVAGRVVLYNGNIYKCIQANGASSTVVAPDSDDTYWQQLDSTQSDSTSLIPNQIITSPVPLTDANLHLLDGALLTGAGAYSAYVTKMSELYNADPTANIWTTESDWQDSVTNYGSCGKFVYDSVNNTLRLPKYDARYLKSTLSASDLGDLINAKAPNITGHIERSGTGVSQYSLFTSSTGAITFTSSSNPGISAISSVNGSNGFDFDASLSSPVYSDSATTIDTDAVKVYYYIVLGTVSKTQIQIDIDNVMADLALKTDTSLSNINNNAKIAIAHSAMPSDTYDDISWGASGDTYTAPADGFFIAKRQTTGSNQYLDIRNYITGLGSRIAYTSSGSDIIVFLPTKKGDVITISYTAGTASTLRFIYAVGSQSEQA